MEVGISNFEAAADAIITGNLELLKHLVTSNPDLVRKRSTRPHRSTLLHYVSANGVEDFRQKTPTNILEITTTLLNAGADINAESDAYGGGATTLMLTATSVHPHQAGVQTALLQMLLDHGALISPGTVGSCLANGQPQAAQFLASHGAPINMEEAAGLGRLDLVHTYLEAGQSLSPTCLHAAAYGLHAEIVELLLQHGAPVNVRDKQHAATPLEMAQYRLSKLEDDTQRERCNQIIRLLVDVEQ